MNVPNPKDIASSREWLETNGLGGFSSSTVTGMNTRRYHGLLTAATKPPVGRVALLSKLEETLVINNNQRFDLATNLFSGSVHPHGYEFLAKFQLNPFPEWTWELPGARVVKTLSMVHGENTVVVTYEIAAEQNCFLEVRPLIAFRDYHSTTHANDGLNRGLAIEPGLVSIEPYPGLPRLYFAHNAREIDQQGYWYYGFEYAIEKERGLDCMEDLFNPFTLRFAGSGATIVASTNWHRADEAGSLQSLEANRRKVSAPHKSPLVNALTAAADQFIVSRDKFKSVIAGYHWFGDWGRDTMISLPGLTLVTGRPDVARSILLEFARHVDQGMLPNRFPDSGEAPEYNTVDATLWFFECARAYVQYTKDPAFIREHLYPVLKDIIDWHIRGTRHGIRVDDDGLLRAGAPGVQLTWMDAKVGDWVVTPRSGKPVEIQALWYNALRTMEEFARIFEDPQTQTLTGKLADRALRSFNDQFWNPEAGCLYDVIDGTERDASIRPNQVIAVSLRHTMLPEDRARPILEVVERELLTPVGLRTLSPKDSRYCPHYEGPGYQRDAAYHQGTVWPWLMGPFVTAYVKAHGRSDVARHRAQGWVEGFLPHLQVAGLGQVSEILDGDAPHTPRGCIAQAWSVAELLRVALEDVYVP
ncbi:MAG TPA: amylo-alpha-1,6-glucosidase [Bryobacteraceae bacterium]|jgi:predicted glycogen debranching enzyme|nr:amylo-alpha-1,6-glucosidase [Bryobacteraceae bacterium]